MNRFLTFAMLLVMFAAVGCGEPSEGGAEGGSPPVDGGGGGDDGADGSGGDGGR